MKLRVQALGSLALSLPVGSDFDNHRAIAAFRQGLNILLCNGVTIHDVRYFLPFLYHSIE